ncbi:MAG: DNA polymerase III subunit delta [Edaphocola sp.]
MSSYNTLLQDLNKGNYAPVYLLDGEEPYYIDILLTVFEEKILAPEERDFNLLVLYGKEAEWKDVVNAARRFPMFANHTVVILKEAWQMKDLGELAGYIEQPSPSTVLVIEHKFKKLDGRNKLAKLIPKKGVYFTSEKLKEDEVPQWVVNYGRTKDVAIGSMEAEMLSVYLGNDLQKIANELEKITINEPGLKQLTVAHIEQYIGVSREYNVFDLPDVLFRGDTNKLARMLGYFTANPKSAPMALVVGTFYGYLNKLYLCHYAQQDFQADRKLGIWSHHRKVAQQLPLPKIHKAIAVLEEFSRKMVGIGSTGNDTALLREMTAKFNHVLYQAN